MLHGGQGWMLNHLAQLFCLPNPDFSHLEEYNNCLACGESN